MIFDMTGMHVERHPELVSYTDLTTTSGAVKSGSADWVSDSELSIPFTPEAAESERWPIMRRLVTKDAAEEQAYIDVENAVASSKAWRTGAGLTLYNNADSLEDTATATTTNMRQAFTGIKQTVAQLALTMERQEWLGKQVLLLMNGR